MNSTILNPPIKLHDMTVLGIDHRNSMVHMNMKLFGDNVRLMEQPNDVIGKYLFRQQYSTMHYLMSEGFINPDQGYNTEIKIEVIHDRF